MGQGSVSLRRFQRLLRLASALPWSDQSRLFDALGRVLLEHIMMTSIASQLSEFRQNDATRLKRSLDLVLTSAGQHSHVTLKQRTHLVDLYVDAILANPSVTGGRATGEKCEWIAGCPAFNRPPANMPPGLVRLSRLESDHVFPKARLLSDFAETPMQTLCAYHNQEWKRAHIAFALDENWLG